MKKRYAFLLFIGLGVSLNAQTIYNATGSGPTGTIQEFIVPACGGTFTIQATGAKGGNTNGGLGASMQGDFTLASGDTVFIVVGQQGVVNNCGGPNASSGGGGGTFVWKNSGLNRTLLLVAGGGGGGNTNWNGGGCDIGIDADIATSGTQGNGVLSALGGTNGDGGFGNAPSGTGSGGAGWLTDGQNSTFGTGCTGGLTYPFFTGGSGSSSFGPGGEGGFGGGGGAVCGNGGGGGYSGGGGGEGSSCRAGGGGGGSYNIGTNQVNQAGIGTADGQVVITQNGPGSLALSATVFPNDTVCISTPVLIDGEGAEVITWSNGYIDSTSFVANSSQSYFLYGQNMAGTCFDTLEVLLVVNPLPVISYATGSEDSLCFGTSAFPLPTGNPPGGLIYGDGVMGAVFFPDSANSGWNTIYYEYMDGNSCTSTVTDSIFMKSCLDVFSEDNFSFQLFPNPATESVSLSFGDIIPERITISNSVGQILWTGSPQEKLVTLSVSDWNAGSYFITAQGTFGRVTQIIQKH